MPDSRGTACTPAFGRTRQWSRWLHHVAVVLATASQLAFSFLPLLDAWHGLSLGPHVEAAGATTHFAHAEDSCPACHVRALDAHATPTLRIAVGADPTRRRADDGAVAPTTAVTSSATSSHRSRAPPIVN
ncbi:MAG TPA: hypothetical protein VGD56_14475 [Gemmatirosa sp.]